MIIGLLGTMGSGKDTVAKILQYYTIPIEYRSLSVSEWVENEFWYDAHMMDCIGDFSGNKAKLSCYIENKKFAGKLKESCALVLGCNVEDFESSEFKSSNLPPIWKREYIANYNQSINGELTHRWLLQEFGATLRNLVNEDIWAISLFNGLQKDSNWVISDLRYENELEFIKCYNPNTGILLPSPEYDDRFVIRIENPNQPVYEDIHESEQLATYTYKRIPELIDFTIINDKDKGINHLSKVIHNLLLENKETIGKYFYV